MSKLVERARAKKRAKALILYLVGAAGPRGFTTTAVYKAFYWTHRFYLEETGREATGWPLAHMPFGPGIDDGEQLLAELVAGHLLAAETLLSGGTVYTRTEAPAKLALEERLVPAAQKAVDHVGTRRATDLSDETHDGGKASRAWQVTQNGDLLELSLDLLSDDDYRSLQRSADEADELLGSLFR